MDVYGRNDTSDEYFRANIWSWPQILDATMVSWHKFGEKFGIQLTDYEVEETNEENGETVVLAPACKDADELFEVMGWNDGRGCENAAQCKALAGAIRMALEDVGIEFNSNWPDNNDSGYAVVDGKILKLTGIIEPRIPTSKEEEEMQEKGWVPKTQITHVKINDEIVPFDAYKFSWGNVPHLCEWVEFLERVDGFSVW